MEKVVSNTSTSKPFCAKVRAKVQKAQWHVGLHDLKLLGVFVEEVAVS